MKQPYWLGFDLGGTKMMASLLDADLKEVASVRKNTRGNAGAKQGMERVMECIREVLEQGNVPPAALGGIGVGCPGVVNLHEGVLRVAPNLGWREVPVQAILKERFGVPVSVLNDVDSGAYGEYRMGAGRKASSMIAVFPGTGVGAGCIHSGRLLTGSRASCMELGHTRVLSHATLGDGSVPPTLESLCSRLAISSAAAVEVFRGNAPHLLEESGTDLNKIKSGSLAKAISSGDRAVEDIVRNAAGLLGVAVSNLVDLLAPDVIVLGGGLVEKMPELFLDQVRKTVKRCATPVLAEDVAIRLAELGDGAVVIGAAAFARDAQENVNYG